MNRFSSNRSERGRVITSEMLASVRPPQRVETRGSMPVMTARKPQPAVMAKAPAPTPAASRPSGPANFLDFTWKSEARFDKTGRVTPYPVPSNDGGAIPGDNLEIAGMTPRFNPKERDELMQMIQSGADNDAVRSRWSEMVLEKTKSAEKLSDDPVIREMARDIVYHRGDGGARRIFRHAFGPDGPGNLPPEQQIERLTQSARWYEENVKGVRPNMQEGLENRFQNRRAFALALLDSSNSKPSGTPKPKRPGEPDAGPYYVTR